MQRKHAKSLTLVPRPVDAGPVGGDQATNNSVCFSAKPLLWIRTTASPTTGFGHLRRALILANMLSDCSVSLFLCDSTDRWTQSQATSHGWRFSIFQPSELLENQPQPAAILIDTRKNAGLTELISWARSNGTPVISIHDLGLNPIHSDLIIDGSIASPIRELLPGALKILTGTSYLILNPTFALYHQKGRRVGKRILSVVVNLGGGDSSRYFIKVLQGLRHWDKEIDIVGIPGFTNWGQEELLARDWRPLRFRFAGKEEAVEKLLFHADVAITAGGLSAYEALCVGTPLLALSYDEFQQATISELARAGACVDLGIGRFLHPSEIPFIMDSLDTDQERRGLYSHRGRQIVDGRGAERVSELIRAVIQNSAKAWSPMVV